MPGSFSRRRFLSQAGAGAAAFTLGPVAAASATMHPTVVPTPILAGNAFDLNIGYRSVNFTGRERLATAINGSVPGPVLRWKQGEWVTIRADVDYEILFAQKLILVPEVELDWFRKDDAE